MPTRTRKVRGSRTQALVAEWYQRLWPAATTNGAGAAGRDVLNVPLSIEVKGRRVFAPLEWIRQARKSACPDQDEFPPHVVMRPDGVGETNVGDFLVIRRLADDTAILEELLELRKRAAVLEKAAPDHYRTKTGKVLTDADIEALAAEAEQGYDVDQLRKGRPWPYDGAEGRARLTGSLETAEHSLLPGEEDSDGPPDHQDA